jgi:hypothetical protein
MKTLRWLVPALTGTLLIRLSEQSQGFLAGAGLVLGAFYIFAALLSAWTDYVRASD